ncbi:hypothetical protein QYE76_039360 [Lolium multiflorum]|uniref:Reverse transcriptase domain-containing protein n=1 Tax=Lolium multiflorum TaxID=4521 RepID=A0AAD8WRR7_LOLMU|nr:hypothetical protein QYE76_039360 [Lolium multiflorum]
MSKAYDRVEWEFLRQMMMKMGFNHSWVDVVMRCVTTVTYRIKVNGQATEQFTPTRGLRQGDPLSPYLFVICAEGLIALLKQAERQGRLCGLKICPRAPSLHGVELVKKGVIWRIGDGEHVNIWQDPWIPRAWCRKILTPRGDNILCKIADLISPITGQWDEQLVMDTFSATEARMILNMPLREGAVDFLA